MPRELKDETGKVYGQLTVLGQAGKTKHGHRICLCLCKCGNQVAIIENNLQRGNTKSCGCLKTRGKDETGNMYGLLTVLKLASKPKTRSGHTWLCQCRCGNQVVVLGVHLRNGNTKSCGCLVSARTYKDETGKTYGKLTVLARAGTSRDGLYTWLCQCECGGQAIVSGSSLRRGITRSCGCLRRKTKRSKDETGNTYGQLTVLGLAGNNEYGASTWFCVCICGEQTIVTGSKLRSGNTKSCGCLKREIGRSKRGGE